MTVEDEHAQREEKTTEDSLPVILISITSLKKITNPQYLAVMINPFSITPRQKLSSPIPCLPKLIIHSRCQLQHWETRRGILHGIPIGTWTAWATPTEH